MEPSPSSPAAQSDGAGSPRRGDRALPLVLLVAAAIIGALLAAFGGSKPSSTADSSASGGATAGESQSATWTPAPRPTGKTVTLTIDFGNGARREFDDLPWTPGLTLGKLMDGAREFRPAVTFTQQGEGEMAFLKSLEGVTHESGPDGRYWLYSVDGRHGEVSFAVQPLEAGAAVLWEFRRGD